jgi:outer membrane protein TolC
MMQALSSYYQFAAGDAAVEAAKASLQSTGESYEAARRRHDLGTVAISDVLQAETAFAQAKLDVQNAEGQYLTKRGQLAKDMGLAANTELVVQRPVVPAQDGFLSQAVSELIASALLDRADLQSAEKNVDQAKANLQAARRSALPQLNFNFDQSYSDNNRFGRRKDMLLGITVNIPIFTGFSTLYQIKGARANLEATQARMDSLRQTVSLDVWQTYQALHTAMENLRMTQSLLKSAEKSAEVALGRYRAGVGSILDVLSAQTALFSARQQRIAAEQEWLVRRTSLSFALGILNRDIVRESVTP